MTSLSAQHMKFSGSRPCLSSAKTLRVDTKQSTDSVCALSIAEYEGIYYVSGRDGIILRILHLY